MGAEHPSHHRVHHGSERKVPRTATTAELDLVGSRLFGTSEPGEEAPVFGLTSNIRSYNPAVRLRFTNGADLWRDLPSNRASPRQAGCGVLGRPEWRR